MLVMLLPVHIVAGGLAIVFGAVALLARKGAFIHRRTGLLFVYAMLIMGISGSILALHKSWTNMNALGGLMSAYFVVTALTTVRRTSAWTHPLNVAALVVGVGLTLLYATLGVKALSVPDRAIDGVPVFMFFFMGTITALAVGGDIRLWLSGSLPASRRLARHLWRMCFALFIAAGSFFSVRERVAKILPQQFTTPAMRALPVALVFVAMFYWLWRIRFRRLLPQAR